MGAAGIDGEGPSVRHRSALWCTRGQAECGAAVVMPDFVVAQEGVMTCASGPGKYTDSWPSSHRTR